MLSAVDGETPLDMANVDNDSPLQRLPGRAQGRTARDFPMAHPITENRNCACNCHTSSQLAGSRQVACVAFTLGAPDSWSTTTTQQYNGT
jgi:hypothetical protein